MRRISYLILMLVWITFQFQSVNGQGLDCNSATMATVGNNTATGPSEGGGAVNICDDGATNANWYVYTPADDVSLTLASCLGGFDTRLNVFTGGCGALVCFAENDDACAMEEGNANEYASLLTFNATAGTTYFFEWDDTWSTEGFDWQLTEGSVIPASDCPSLTLPEDEAIDVIIDVDNMDAITIEWIIATTGEPATGFQVFFGSSPDELINIGTAASTSETINITGIDPATTYYWSIVPINDAGSSEDCEVFSFTTEGEVDCPELGLNIGVACDDMNPETINDVVSDDCVCVGTLASLNPTCQDFIEIGQGVIFDAQISGGEGATNSCATGATQAIWYSFTSVANGSCTVSSSIDLDEPDTRVSIHTGTCDELVCYASDDDSGEGFTSIVTFDVAEGETYFIEWDDRWNTDPFDFELSCDFDDPELVANVRLLNVNQTTHQITFKNFGESDQDISEWRLCSNFNYSGSLSTGVSIVDGDLLLSGDEEVTVEWTPATGFRESGDDIGIYLPTGAFSDPNAMVDFMQYLSAGNGRESVAVEKGIWGEGDFVTGDSPFVFDGTGADTGVGFWSGFSLADSDGDGIADIEDNCVETPNEDQLDLDEDGMGDACDIDIDGDGVINDDDCAPIDVSIFPGASCDDGDDETVEDVILTDCSCVGILNSDVDGDGILDANDNCPLQPNEDQSDIDGDGMGDVCDEDMDGDGDLNTVDCDPIDNSVFFGASCDDGDEMTENDIITDDCSCMGTEILDSDGDGIADADDNCPETSNEDQADLDDDGIGDVCDDDIDGDGDTNENDCEPLNADVFLGAECDDNDPNTTGDSIQEDCSCEGVNGIEDFSNVFNELNLFPNPASDGITIQFNMLQDISSDYVEYSVFDVSGRLLSIDKSDLEAGENSQLIITKKLNQGLYFLKIDTESHTITKRFSILK